MTDATTEKKTRKPRVDYGYAPTSRIRIVPEKEHNYRGHRKAWFESVAAANGQTVAEWEAMNTLKDEKNKPRGWLRFFAEDGTVVLDKAA
jgi:hypothetical protein